MKNTLILSLGVLFLALGGCVNSFAKVRSAVSEAPDWYKGQREAMSREGFPDLGDVPELRKDVVSGADLITSRADIKSTQEMFATHPRAQAATTGAAELRAEMEALQAELEALDTPANFLTSAEIAAIRAEFDIGRAKLKF